MKCSTYDADFFCHENEYVNFQTAENWRIFDRNKQLYQQNLSPKFMDRRFLAIVLGILAWSIGS